MSILANDGFEIYFKEKLWELIPPVYRQEDGLGNNPGVLRALVEVLAKQAAILRRSNDHLWDDQFIDLCQDWAVPYISDLLGTRLVSSENKRGRRVDVAKTIYYRRRKGTLRVLEELIRDITGWEGKVVENFNRLGRMRHGLDPEPNGLGGRFTGTLPGGLADLRSECGSELTNGPFDEYHHTADMRRYNGLNGRYGIPKLAIHLYTLKAYEVTESTPFNLIPGQKLTFDPSGRSIPLFMPGYRSEDFNWNEWHSALEWEIPSRIRCRLLNHAEYKLSESLIQTLSGNPGLSTNAVTDLHRIINRRFPNEGQLKNTLLSFPSHPELLSPAIYKSIIADSIVEDCGKNILLKNAIRISEGVNGIPPEEIVSGNINNPATALISEKRLVIDPEGGMLLFLGTPSTAKPMVSYHYGFSGDIGAGTYDRPKVEEVEPDSTIKEGGPIIITGIWKDGITLIQDSKTYWLLNYNLNVVNMVLQAANRTRPYIRLGSDLSLTQGIIPDNKKAELCMDGLWLGADNDSASPLNININGDFRSVVISHCTIDPGGETGFASKIIQPLQLIINGNIDYLIIDSSITGPVMTGVSGHIENVIIRDSILQSIDNKTPVLQITDGVVTMERVTVFGDINVHRLWATETLITGVAHVTDTQTGCFRFSAANKNSRLPKPYESHLFSADTNHWFTSRRFGDPGFGQMSESAPAELYRGAENGSEVGAFSSLINPIKSESLRNKIEEYMPFGLIPIFIKET